MTLSVLLIIGAAVIQVEGRPPEYEYDPEDLARGMAIVRGVKAPAETFEELRGRLFAELGVSLSSDGRWNLGGLQVLCIPTPEGYRR